MSLNAFPVFTVLVALASAADRDNSLDGIITVPIDTGTLGWVQTGAAASRLYYFDKSDNATPPDGVTIIAPLTGPGRWKLLTTPGAGISCASAYAFNSVTTPPGNPFLALTTGGDFMFPNAHSVIPGPGTPLAVGDFTIAAGDALKFEYSLPSLFSIFSGPVLDAFNASYRFAPALFDIGAGTWNLMDGDYAPNIPFGNDSGFVYVEPNTDFEPRSTTPSGVMIFRPPAGQYRIGIYVESISSSQAGQFTYASLVGAPKLSAHKVEAECVLGAYTVTALVPITPGNVPWSNPS